MKPCCVKKTPRGPHKNQAEGDTPVFFRAKTTPRPKTGLKKKEIEASRTRKIIRGKLHQSKKYFRHISRGGVLRKGEWAAHGFQGIRHYR